jgi:DNA-binding SARP family transcriptional activator
VARPWSPFGRKVLVAGARPAIDDAEPSDQGRLDEVARLLSVLGPVGSSSASAADAARQLHASGVEHLRVAAELEAAARQHRLAARRASRRASAALAGFDPPDGPDNRPFVDRRDEDTRHTDAVAPAESSSQAVTPGRHLVDDDDERARTVARRADVTVRVLGPLQVVAGDRTIAWGGTRGRALFQYLVLHDGPVHREQLMELLWPGYGYGSARNNLNVCLYGLRRSLEAAGSTQEHVVYRDGCYELNRDLAWAVDRDEFLRLSAAAHSSAGQGERDRALIAAMSASASYRGPLFQDDAAGEWFVPERRWLAEQHLGLLEFEVELHLDLDDVEGARDVAGRLLREEPCRESAHRLLMTCYARQNQGDLLARQFHLCVKTLEQELGIAPTPETARLYDELSGRHRRDEPGIQR